MARVILQQNSNIKAVICESYKPDTTFRLNEGAKGKVALSFSQMPVECILMEIHYCLYYTTYIVEYQWFLTHFIADIPYLTIAELNGQVSKEYIENHVDAMLDDAVYRMPQWLANKCLDIYDTFLAAPKEIKPRTPRVKAGYRGLLDRLQKVC